MTITCFGATEGDGIPKKYTEWYTQIASMKIKVVENMLLGHHSNFLINVGSRLKYRF